MICVQAYFGREFAAQIPLIIICHVKATPMLNILESISLDRAKWYFVIFVHVLHIAHHYCSRALCDIVTHMV